MEDLDYVSPQSIDEAISILAAGGTSAKVFAGGTDLLVQIHEEIIEPTILVDIKNIPELRKIRFEKDFIVVGAAITGAELGENEKIKVTWPGVVEAVELIGSYQIQGRATIGGNLCNASPAADSVPAFVAAGALIQIVGPDGNRSISTQDFLVGPGTTALKQGEFVTHIKLPQRSGKTGDAYLRFIPRTEMDIAVVGAGISVSLNSDGICDDVRLALGAVAPTAILVESATDILIGNKLNDSTLDALSEAAKKACSPISDKRGTDEFRKEVAGVLTGRAAKIAWSRAENK